MQHTVPEVGGGGAFYAKKTKGSVSNKKRKGGGKGVWVFMDILWLPVANAFKNRSFSLQIVHCNFPVSIIALPIKK